MSLYFDRDGRPLSFEKATSLFKEDNAKRLVGRTPVGDGCVVSTMHLVIDHSGGTGPPLIFETMVFGGPNDEWQERYSTLQEAEAGHLRAVAALIKGEVLA